MGYNNIGDDGIAALAKSLSNSSITLLDVRECGISIVGARLIMNSAMVSAVCKDVVIDGKYDDEEEEEVKTMRNSLYDRIRQSVRVLVLYYDDVANYYCHGNRQVIKLVPAKIKIVLKRSL